MNRKDRICRHIGAGFLLAIVAGGLMGFVTEDKGSPVDLSWTGRYPVLVIAHRGFSGQAPENTLAAFRKAIDAGSDAIEFDVRFSKDGHLVLIHDDTVDRTTEGKGKVSELTLEELKKLDAGSWKGTAFTGERIPTLKEALDLARGRILLDIEIKDGDQGSRSMVDLADLTLEAVQKAGMEGQVLFSSFDRGAVERVRTRAPHIPVAYLTDKPWSSPLEASGGMPLRILDVRRSSVNPANVALARQGGIRVLVWTANTPEDMEKLVTLGVDGIITDHPDRLIDLLKNRRQ
jgi:glycerophosphoryl diester phosphodiesterase